MPSEFVCCHCLLCPEVCLICDVRTSLLPTVTRRGLLCLMVSFWHFRFWPVAVTVPDTIANIGCKGTRPVPVFKPVHLRYQRPVWGILGGCDALVEAVSVTRRVALSTRGKGAPRRGVAKEMTISCCACGLLGDSPFH